MNITAVNSEYCYMLSSCDFASTMADLLDSQASSRSLDIVKQAIHELVDGREHVYNSNERDLMKLNLSRLLICLLIRARETDSEKLEKLADFLHLFPNMSEEFILSVVYDTGLTQAFVQNICELNQESAHEILEVMLVQSQGKAEIQFSTTVRICEQLSKLVPNCTSTFPQISTKAHALLREFLPQINVDKLKENSPKLTSEFLALVDAYTDAYCLKDGRKMTSPSVLFTKNPSGDKIFADLFMLSYGLYEDVDIHANLDEKFNHLLTVLNTLIGDVDMAKVTADLDFYTLWTQARRLRQVLRRSDYREIASKIDKFESRVRYRLIKSAKFSNETKIDDCLYLLSNNLYKKEMMELLIESLSDPVHCSKIEPYFENNLILLCDSTYLIRLVKITRLTRLISRSKKSRNNLCQLLKRAYMKSDAQLQNQVLLGVHNNGVETLNFDPSTDTISVLNRVTLKENQVSYLSDVSWLILQKPHDLLLQMMRLACDNMEFCKVFIQILEKLPNAGLVLITERKLTNFTLCVERLLETELSENQEQNLKFLVTSLLYGNCLNLSELVSEIVFRSLSVDFIKSDNRSPLNFSFDILEKLLKKRLLANLVAPPSVVSVLYCLCEVQVFCGNAVWYRQQSVIRERAKTCIHGLVKIWQRENFDSRVAVWLQKKLTPLGAIQFLFLNFDPYPQKGLKTTLVKSTVDFLQAQEPSQVHTSLLTILTLSSLTNQILEYFQNMSGRRRLLYSVLVTALVQQLPKSTPDETLRLYQLVSHWLKVGTVTVEGKKDASSVVYVSKIWLDSMLVVFHPDVGWMENAMKGYLIRNYAVILKQMLTDAKTTNADLSQPQSILLHAIEATRKLSVDITEPVLIFVLDAVKSLKEHVDFDEGKIPKITDLDAYKYHIRADSQNS